MVAPSVVSESSLSYVVAIFGPARDFTYNTLDYNLHGAMPDTHGSYSSTA